MEAGQRQSGAAPIDCLSTANPRLRDSSRTARRSHTATPAPRASASRLADTRTPECPEGGCGACHPRPTNTAQRRNSRHDKPSADIASNNRQAHAVPAVASKQRFRRGACSTTHDASTALHQPFRPPCRTLRRREKSAAPSPRTDPGGRPPGTPLDAYCRPTLCTTCSRRSRRITSARWRRSRTWMLKRSTAALKSRSR